MNERAAFVNKAALEDRHRLAQIRPPAVCAFAVSN
jgi:hypothetical protein